MALLHSLGAYQAEFNSNSLPFHARSESSTAASATSQKSTGLDTPFLLGDWLVDPHRGRITRNGESHMLRAQVMAVLTYLADHPTRAVGIEELMKRLWNGRIVTTGTVYNCLGELRNCLGHREIPADGHGARRYVETVPKRGYRLSVRPEPVVDEVPVVAVLPFRCLSDRLSHVNFSLGLHEELLTLLATSPRRRVVSHQAVCALEPYGLKVPEVCQRLGATLLIEGTVRFDDDSVCVTSHSVRAGTGLRGHSCQHEAGFAIDSNGSFRLQRQLAGCISSDLITS